MENKEQISNGRMENGRKHIFYSTTKENEKKKKNWGKKNMLRNIALRIKDICDLIKEYVVPQSPV